MLSDKGFERATETDLQTGYVVFVQSVESGRRYAAMRRRNAPAAIITVASSLNKMKRNTLFAAVAAVVVAGCGHRDDTVLTGPDGSKMTISKDA